MRTSGCLMATDTSTATTARRQLALVARARDITASLDHGPYLPAPLSVLDAPWRTYGWLAQLESGGQSGCAAQPGEPPSVCGGVAADQCARQPVAGGLALGSSAVVRSRRGSGES